MNILERIELKYKSHKPKASSKPGIPIERIIYFPPTSEVLISSRHSIRSIKLNGDVTLLSGSPAEEGHTDGEKKGARWNFPIGICLACFTPPIGVDPIQNTSSIPPKLNYLNFNDYVQLKNPIFARYKYKSFSSFPTHRSAENFPSFFGPLSTDENASKEQDFGNNRGLTDTTSADDQEMKFEVSSSHPRPVLLVADSKNHVIRCLSLYTEYYYESDDMNEDWGSEEEEFVESSQAASSSSEISNSNLKQLKKVIQKGEVWRICGTGHLGRVDGPTFLASFNTPTDVLISPVTGDIFIADSMNNLIRVLSEGKVTTVAGNGETNYLDGFSLESSFSRPVALAFALNLDLFVSDQNNNCIRRIYLDQGEVKTVQGVKLNFPSGIFSTPNGKLFIADCSNHCVCILADDGEIHAWPSFKNIKNDNIAENQFEGIEKLKFPSHFAFHPDGHLFISHHRDTHLNAVYDIAPPPLSLEKLFTSDIILPDFKLDLKNASNHFNSSWNLHSALLHLRCPTLLLPSIKETIEASPVSSQSVEAFVKFIYSDSAPIDFSYTLIGLNNSSYGQRTDVTEKTTYQICLLLNLMFLAETCEMIDVKEFLEIEIFSRLSYMTHRVLLAADLEQKQGETDLKVKEAVESTKMAVLDEMFAGCGVATILKSMSLLTPLLHHFRMIPPSMFEANVCRLEPYVKSAKVRMNIKNEVEKENFDDSLPTSLYTTSPPFGYLSKDTLSLFEQYCTFSVLEHVDLEQLQGDKRQNDFLPSLEPDFKIIVGKCQFLVHSWLLCARWSYFTQMIQFGGQELEQRVLFLDLEVFKTFQNFALNFSAQYFHLFLKYIYTGDSNHIKTEMDVYEVLRLASALGGLEEEIWKLLNLKAQRFIYSALCSPLCPPISPLAIIQRLMMILEYPNLSVSWIERGRRMVAAHLNEIMCDERGAALLNSLGSDEVAKLFFMSYDKEWKQT